MDKSRRQLGAFTLIELVVAMMIVVILGLSLVASIRTAFHAQQSAETAVEPARTADIALQFIGDDLQNAMPPGTLAQSFVGTDGRDDRGHDGDDLLFYTTADSPDHPAANGEIKEVELTIEVPNGGSDHVLVRRVIRNLLTQVQPAPDEEILCRGVSGFNLRYFDGTDWQDTWDSTETTTPLPSAVEVTLELDRPLNSPDARTLRFVRVFPLSCSTAADTTGALP